MTIHIRLRKIGDERIDNDVRWSVECEVLDQIVLIGPMFKTRLAAEELIATIEFKKPRRLTMRLKRKVV